MPRKVLVAVPDLMLQSRITEAARRAGVEVVLASSAEEVLTAGRREKPGLVILDLESPRVQADRALQRLRSDPELCAVPTLGFYSHVDKRLAERMVQAGCDRAIPRGQFVDQLEAILKPFAPGPSTS
jgi:two-component system, cell cycle response regulator DivK